MTATHAKDMSFTIPDFLKEYAEDGDSDTVVVLYAIVVRGNLPTSVLSYESTKVLSYFRTKVQRCTKVLSKAKVRKYFRTFVLSYFNKVRKYSTKVLCTKVQSTFVGITRV
jgi:hypothetical protein